MKLLALLLMLSPAFIIGMCESENNHGYPKKVYFPPEGGTQTFVGEYPFCSIAIADYSGHYGYTDFDEDTTITATNKWLTAKQRWDSDTLIITAEPAPSSKKRKLHVYGEFPVDYANITVIQGR